MLQPGASYHQWGWWRGFSAPGERSGYLGASRVDLHVLARGKSGYLRRRHLVAKPRPHCPWRFCLAWFEPAFKPGAEKASLLFKNVQNCAASDPLLATPFRTRAARQAFHFRNKSHKQVNALTISDQKQAWSARKSAELYDIDEWGSGYFGVSPEGEVVVREASSSGTGAGVGLQDEDRWVRVGGLGTGLLRLRDTRVAGSTSW